MLAMVKVVLLLLVVFKATALENYHETDSNHELFPYSSPSPSPFSYPPQSSTDVGEQKKSTEGCLDECLNSCKNKISIVRRQICIANCNAKCSSASDYGFDCIVHCAQSSQNTLRNDANMMNDRISSSCHQQCKRD